METTSARLTTGSLHRILGDSITITDGGGSSAAAAAQLDTSLWEAIHILQVLSIRKISPAREGSATDRYRLIVSDGAHFTQAMLSTQLNALIDEQQLRKYTVVKVEKLTCNVVQNKKLLILLHVSPVEHHDQRIGEPKNMEPVGNQQGQAGAGAGTGALVSSAATDVTMASASNYLSTAQRGAGAGTAAPRPAVAAGAGSTRASSMNIFPIEGISPYTNKWTIRARVTQKSEMRYYSTPKGGDGKLFTVTFMDESGEIRATAFNLVAEQLYERLEEGKVYYVGKSRCSIAKRKFVQSQQEWEIALDANSEIVECEDQENAPKIKYNFVQLADLAERKADEYCDVIGIVKEVSGVSEIISKKTSKQLQKRELTLVDRSELETQLTLWGKQAETFNVEPESVIAFKSVRIGDFGGRSLSMTSGSSMEVNPDIVDAHVLRGWYDSKGKETAFKTHAIGGGGIGMGGGFNRKEMKTVSEIKEGQANGPSGAQTMSFSCRATVVHIKSDSLWYPACHVCHKKVIEGGDGWRCEKCSTTRDRPEHRYILSLSVADHTAQVWFQGFNEIGNILFGMSADQLAEIKERSEAEFNSVVARATCKAYNFAVRAKQETYNDIARTRLGITKMLPLDYKEEAWLLLEQLQSEWGAAN